MLYLLPYLLFTLAYAALVIGGLRRIGLGYALGGLFFSLIMMIAMVLLTLPAAAGVAALASGHAGEVLTQAVQALIEEGVRAAVMALAIRRADGVDDLAKLALGVGLVFAVAENTAALGPIHIVAYQCAAGPQACAPVWDYALLTGLSAVQALRLCAHVLMAFLGAAALLERRYGTLAAVIGVHVGVNIVDDLIFGPMDLVTEALAAPAKQALGLAALLTLGRAAGLLPPLRTLAARARRA